MHLRKGTVIGKASTTELVFEPIDLKGAMPNNACLVSDGLSDTSSDSSSSFYFNCFPSSTEPSIPPLSEGEVRRRTDREVIKTN